MSRKVKVANKEVKERDDEDKKEGDRLEWKGKKRRKKQKHKMN